MLVYDERIAKRYMDGIAAQIDQAMIEASLRINGTDVVVTPGQIGRTLIVRAGDHPGDAAQPDRRIIPLVVRGPPGDPGRQRSG